jgi:hypothetical protein
MAKRENIDKIKKLVRNSERIQEFIEFAEDIDEIKSIELFCDRKKSGTQTTKNIPLTTETIKLTKQYLANVCRALEDELDVIDDMLDEL